MNTRWKLNRYANAYKFHRIWPETVGFNGSDPFRKVAYFLSHPLSIFQVWLNPEWINVCIFDMLTRGDIPHVHEATSFLEVSHLLATGKANVNKHKIQFLLAPCVFARRLLLAFSSLFFSFLGAASAGARVLSVSVLFLRGGAVKPTWRFAINAPGKKQAGEHQLMPFPLWSAQRSCALTAEKLTEIHPIWVTQSALKKPLRKLGSRGGNSMLRNNLWLPHVAGTERNGDGTQQKGLLYCQLTAGFCG